MQAQELERWLHSVEGAFADRILPIDGAAADLWGKMSAVRPVPVIDALLAATAQLHGIILVTRNTRHLAGLGAPTLNPFEARSAEACVVSESGAY